MAPALDFEDVAALTGRTEGDDVGEEDELTAGLVAELVADVDPAPEAEVDEEAVRQDVSSPAATENIGDIA